MTVSGRIQRDLNQSRVEHLLAEFDLDDFGLPVVSWRDGKYYIIDGQHRIEALKRWLGKGWETQKIECRVFQGLSEKDEADMFDRLNDVLIVSAFDKFKNRVTAGREVEVAVNRVVQEQGLTIARTRKQTGAACVSSVSSLLKVYTRSDGVVLGRTLRIIRDAWGDVGFEAAVIDGVGLFCQRYAGVLDEKRVIDKLHNTRGGVKGLLGKADVLHKQTGNARGQCVAAAVVDIVNSGAGGKKLPSWWKIQAEEEERA